MHKKCGMHAPLRFQCSRIIILCKHRINPLRAKGDGCGLLCHDFLLFLLSR